MRVELQVSYADIPITDGDGARVPAPVSSLGVAAADASTKGLEDTTGDGTSPPSRCAMSPFRAWDHSRRSMLEGDSDNSSVTPRLYTTTMGGCGCQGGQ